MCIHIPHRLTLAPGPGPPPCSYAHNVVCVSLWAIFAGCLISNIGFGYGGVDGINAEYIPTYHKLQIAIVIGWLFFAGMCTFFPRFPDVWIVVWLFFRSPVFSNVAQNQRFETDNIPVLVVIFCGLLMIAIRLKLVISCLLDIRKHR